MFCTVRYNAVELTATGKGERTLLHRMSEGVHVQAYDAGEGKVAAVIIIAPSVLPESKGSPLSEKEWPVEVNPSS